MSKIGKKPISIPSGVEVKITGNHVAVKGPKGELSYDLLDGVNALLQEHEIVISITNLEKKNLWGLTRTLISNMIEGVNKGYEKKLLLMGVGYSAKKEGKGIIFALGLSHKVKVDIPALIQHEVEQDAKGNYVLTFKSYDKQFLGAFTAKIRELKKPEPYKGKGIRYFDEIVKIKVGKTAKK